MNVRIHPLDIRLAELPHHRRAWALLALWGIVRVAKPGLDAVAWLVRIVLWGCVLVTLARIGMWWIQ